MRLQNVAFDILITRTFLLDFLWICSRENISYRKRDLLNPLTADDTYTGESDLCSLLCGYLLGTRLV